MSGRQNYQRVAGAFGKVLKSVREQLAMSQEVLAERAGFDRTYPSMLERGKRCPTLAMVLRVADALGVEAETLLRDTKRLLKGNMP